MSAGGLAGASAESAEAAVARRRRKLGASRLTRQQLRDRQHAAAGILLGTSLLLASRQQPI
jgi:hypothetical protein